MGIQKAPSIGVIILAAGLGKRMCSRLPKVLHEIGGQPLVFHVLKRVMEVIPKASIAIVVGHVHEKVENAIRSTSQFKDLNLNFIYQPEQNGTGDAARVAMDSPWGHSMVNNKTPILVLPGDLPLLSADLIAQMIEPLSKSAALRLLTTELSNPTGYGRIVRRGKKGPVLRIVEEKDANLREKGISEVNSSIYLFQSVFLRAALQRLSNKNVQKEYYLTDLIAQAVRAKKRIDVVQWHFSEDLFGVNELWELTKAGQILNLRYLKKWANKGVRFIDPSRTLVDVSVELAEDVVIYPGAILSGSTQISKGAIIGPGVFLKNVQVGEEANIKTGTVAEDSRIEAKANVGPYAHLRPGSLVGKGVKIGNFVELKKAKIGADSSIAHLSYVGDAEIGERVNVGCGFITCNFDGRVIDGERKHRTIIENDVFLGSDCQAVAPVRIGKGAYIASGSTITEDVEAGSLAIARCRQVVKAGYARKLKGES